MLGYKKNMPTTISEMLYFNFMLSGDKIFHTDQPTPHSRCLDMCIEINYHPMWMKLYNSLLSDQKEKVSLSPTPPYSSKRKIIKL